uniref:Bromo domain-containing protein n=1 Tax=Proboscia inermis TaxID=420281 RepID=A0A7S0GJY7_9STRA|mmetsp:Transcript_39813/g.47837  ORF Transcript_39813/g.47837 Transcript_39813/m.47837 type:complete len:229 (+) Transcript_39813:88-774(+)|eukprot:CAMPEP_0171311660 /NCGR_PEP_ID=MMETSP0816-20121228/21930_1 /TAXON_ID=420281 /ORGANISM="Proboscia inermis, Strain CCAP1064/1" /LENGTH=228 /DNA_ID=CAMNT_0011796581 /DNA_START=51 /DNA_END=737 /DNA_ORIENTATION=+
MVSSEWVAMKKVVQQIYSRADAEPFREAVDWNALGLFDYPILIKNPMDLGSVQNKLESSEYASINDAAKDVRQIWINCKTYNADGSEFYNLAEGFSKRFEEKFAKLLKDHNITGSSGESADGEGSSPAAPEPSIEEKKSFAKSLYKITKEQLGKVICILDEKCPAALTKNEAEDEVEINVDNISPSVFHDEVVSYVRSCQGEAGSVGRKKKNSSSNITKSTKKSKTSS